MKVLVCGASGCVGAATVHALRSRGHEVVEGARRAADADRRAMHIDFMVPRVPEAWAEVLRRERIEVVVNCIGILMPARGQSFERVHTEGPLELFRGAVQAGVRRVIQVSALGVTDDAQALATPYLRSKLKADDALASLPVEWAVLRPSLVYGPGSQSAALFSTLASLPVIALPGRGQQAVQPLHVYELAEAIARLVEQPSPLAEVLEIGGPQPLSYRDMLVAYRAAQGFGPALWCPVPLALMRGLAWLAEGLPQRVYCRDTLNLLERGSMPRENALPRLLGRRPTTMAQGLVVTPPRPLVDLQVSLSPAAQWIARAALSFMWLYTALISAWLPQQSGVLALLARCGFEGRVGVAALVFSCTLNVVLGILVLRRPTPWAMALQVVSVIAYTVTAAVNMPELTLDHCGPLVKNLPVLALLLLLWIAAPTPRAQQAQAPRARVGHASA